MPSSVSSSMEGDWSWRKPELPIRALTRWNSGCLEAPCLESKWRWTCKASFKPSGSARLEKVFRDHVDEAGNRVYVAYQSFKLERALSPAFWIAAGVLLAVYGLIALEVMHRTPAALLGASALLFVTYYTVGTFLPG